VPPRPIRTLHLDDLAELAAKCPGGFTHFVILRVDPCGTAADPNVGKQLGVKAQGVLVQAVAGGSAAAAAGLLPTRRGLGGIVAGDVIIAADGAQVVGEGDLVAVGLSQWRC